MGLSVVTAPASEPVSLADMKLFLRVTEATQNDIISSLISAARRVIEDKIGFSLMTATFDFTARKWPDLSMGHRIYLPRNPITSITSIQYINQLSVLTTYSSTEYTLIGSTAFEPAYVRWHPDYPFWPTIRDVVDAIRIRFVAGYSSAANVPANLKLAVKLLVAHWYDNRVEPNQLAKQKHEYKNFPLGVQALTSQLRPVVRSEWMLTDV